MCRRHFLAALAATALSTGAAAAAPADSAQPLDAATLDTIINSRSSAGSWKRPLA